MDRSLHCHSQLPISPTAGNPWQSPCRSVRERLASSLGAALEKHVLAKLSNTWWNVQLQVSSWGLLHVLILELGDVDIGCKVNKVWANWRSHIPWIFRPVKLISPEVALLRRHWVNRKPWWPDGFSVKLRPTSNYKVSKRFRGKLSYLVAGCFTIQVTSVCTTMACQQWNSLLHIS